jgi:hypothetical protein
VLPQVFEEARKQVVSAAREAALRPHSCIRRCTAGETPPRVPVRALVELRFEFRAEGMSAITYRIEGP